MPLVSRRDFLGVSAAAGILAWQSRATAQASLPPICCFSKHLQFIKDYTSLAETAKALGLDGLDLTVRGGGHVLPENVETDLRKAVDAAQSAGISVPMITTNLQNGEDISAEPIMEAASKAGVHFLRVGGREKYVSDRPIPDQLDGQIEAFRALAHLAEAHGVVCGYHNHSGRDNVGAPLWDVQRMIHEIDKASFGSNFDIGHATVEGGLGGWYINARTMASHIRMTAIKDFVWENGKVRWVPLGQGQVQLVDYFRVLKVNNFSGPISIHFEYDTSSDDALLNDIESAVQTTRDALIEAGY
ncbi:MAG: hypothetical protein AMXMBFR84_46190 [Candidatus Hydrogenedentota bacterium]